ncbi:hypothetical protein M422DRAFT_270184 [Sphaerobolus stellatus SS14]|uniref:Uncharacterized protein n=1 Tax=Sphaerobolus stellatus (strain SS14) TaxID=990650 RepID=A0A0C9TGE9_SPHS4|nr:hypothetical protein M422DRAFT_270184 [Sphaerobolus stellatus SS14]
MCELSKPRLNLIDEGFVYVNEDIAEMELHWRVQKTGGSPVELGSLEVTVVATPLSLPPGSHFLVA